MKREGVAYGVVGAFVLLALGALMVVLERLTGDQGPADAYHVIYGEVGGLTPGAAVTFEGFPIGKVASIEPERGPEGMHYRVGLEVRAGWPIPEDSLARLTSAGIIAQLGVDIDEGRAARVLAPGSAIPGRDPVNVFAALNDVAADFRTLSNEGIRPALEALTARLGEVTGELTDLSRSSVRPLIESLRNRVEDADEVTHRANALLASLQAASAGLEELLGPENRRHVGNVVTNVDALSRELQQVAVRIEDTRGRLDAVLVGVDALVGENRQPMVRLMTDLSAGAADLRTVVGAFADEVDAIVHNLEGSTRNLYEFTRAVRENPAILLTSDPKVDPEGER